MSRVVLALFVTSAGVTAQSSAALETPIQKTSYALGMDLGRQFRQASLAVDPALFSRGLKDGLAGGKTLLTEEQAHAILSALQASQKRKQDDAKHGSEEGHSELEMLGAYNAAKGAAFRAANAKKEGVVTLPSGLQYRILVAGAGPKPAASGTVACRFRANLLEGTELDDTFKESEPKTLKLKETIKGLSEALQLMPCGSKWELVVPPNLAYGETGLGPIGPNATLKYELELLSIQ